MNDDDVKALVEKARLWGFDEVAFDPGAAATLIVKMADALEAVTAAPVKTVQDVLELLDAFHGDNRMGYDAYTNLHDAVALLEVRPAPAVDREALAAELYTGYTAKEWHRADEIERSDWRLVAQEVIDTGILRDVRDVQAEQRERDAQIADSIGHQENNRYSHIAWEVAQAIREARSGR